MHTHPESGKKLLFANPGFGDMTEEASEPILRPLYAVPTEHHNIYRHLWSSATSSGDRPFRRLRSPRT